MSELEQQLAVLRQRAQQAQARQAQAHAEAQQARGALAAVEKDMAAEFPELAQVDVQTLLAHLAAEAQTEVSKVSEALAAAEGTA